MCSSSSSCGCDCTVPISIPTGNNGPAGTNGTNGTDGIYGGYSSDWIFSANTGSGTSSTEIRLNNAAPASVTKIYLNDVNSDSVDVSGFLASFTNSSNFGKIRLFDEADNTTFAYYEITAVTDNTTEYELTVTYIDHNSTFSAADKVVVSFSANGANGAVGVAGASGTSILVNNTASDSTTSASLVLIGTKTYTVPANTLASDGDKLRIIANLKKTTQYLAAVSIQINGNWFTATPTALSFMEGSDEMKIELELTRKSNTTAAADVKWIQSSFPSYLGKNGFTYENSASIGVVDFTGATFVIAVHGSILAGGTLYCEQLTIEKFAI